MRAVVLGLAALRAAARPPPPTQLGDPQNPRKELQLRPFPDDGDYVRVFVTFTRGWTERGQGKCKADKADCFAEVDGARTGTVANDKTPEWFRGRAASTIRGPGSHGKRISK